MAYVGKDGKDGKDDNKRISLDRKYCNMEYVNKSCTQELTFFLDRYNLLDELPPEQRSAPRLA